MGSAMESSASILQLQDNVAKKRMVFSSAVIDDMLSQRVYKNVSQIFKKFV